MIPRRAFAVFFVSALVPALSVAKRRYARVVHERETAAPTPDAQEVGPPNGALRSVTIDQQLLKCNRQFDLLEVVEGPPRLLAIGLHEDTAIVVRGNRFEVTGRSYVLIDDNQRRIPPYRTFHALAPGGQDDLKTRKAERHARTMNPLDASRRTEVATGE